MTAKLYYRCRHCRAQTCITVHIKSNDWQSAVIHIANGIMTDVVESDICFVTKFHCCDDNDSQFGVNELIKVTKT